MNKVHSGFLGDLIEVRKAFSSRNEERIAELMDKSESPSELSRSIRFGFTNYWTEVEGLSFSEVSTIWAIPILIGVVAQMPVAAEVGSGDERDELGSG